MLTMFIYHTTSDGRALVSLPVKWERVPLEAQKFGVLDDGVCKSKDGVHAAYLLDGEFRFVHGNDVYRAVRFRSQWSWCSWSIYLNGVKTSHTGDLPERMNLYVPIEVAKEGE
jgi:hypothetical protein